MYLFQSLDHVRQLADLWVHSYNTERPHQALGGVPPLAFTHHSQPPNPNPFKLQKLHF